MASNKQHRALEAKEGWVEEGGEEGGDAHDRLDLPSPLCWP